jgi:hypothetical protein
VAVDQGKLDTRRKDLWRRGNGTFDYKMFDVLVASSPEMPKCQ